MKPYIGKHRALSGEITCNFRLLWNRADTC